MNFTEEEEFIRHNVFREELYVYAHLSPKEFQVKVEKFKQEYSHLIKGQKYRPLDVSWYQFRKHIKNFYK